MMREKDILLDAVDDTAIRIAIILSDIERGMKIVAKTAEVRGSSALLTFSLLSEFERTNLDIRRWHSTPFDQMRKIPEDDPSDFSYVILGNVDDVEGSTFIDHTPRYAAVDKRGLGNFDAVLEDIIRFQPRDRRMGGRRRPAH